MVCVGDYHPSIRNDSSRHHDNDEDKEDELDDDYEPEPADTSFSQQNLQLAVKLDHVGDILVNVIVDFVEHLVLQVHLISEVLVLVIQLSNDVRDLVQLLVSLCELVFVLHHHLLIRKLLGVAVLAILLPLGFMHVVLLQVGNLIAHVYFAWGGSLHESFLLKDKLCFFN